MFSGGALSQFSVFVLGIMPYISASIIMQMGQVISPRIERLMSEGQAGRKKINQYTRYLTIGIAIVQSFAIAMSLESMKNLGGNQNIVIEAGWGFRLMTIITMTAGSCFVMWLGTDYRSRRGQRRITHHHRGNYRRSSFGHWLDGDQARDW